MAYGYQRARVPSILNYEEAVKREAEITPIRGTNIKPIGLRRNKHMSISKNADNEIVCTLYHTDVIKFKPDGDIVVKVDGWASNTTIGFLTDVLGADFYIFDKQVWVNAKILGGQQVMHFPIRTHFENTFRRAGDARYGLVAIDPLILKTHQVKRSEMAKIRKKYEGFTKYVDAMNRLRVDERGRIEIAHAEMEARLGGGQFWQRKPMALVIHPTMKPEDEQIQEFMQLITPSDQDKTEDYYTAYVWLGGACDRYIGLSGSSHLAKTRSFIAPVQTEKVFNELLLYVHRDEVFAETEYFGEAKKDKYGKFFRE